MQLRILATSVQSLLHSCKTRKDNESKDHRDAFRGISEYHEDLSAAKDIGRYTLRWGAQSHHLRNITEMILCPLARKSAPPGGTEPCNIISSVPSKRIKLQSSANSTTRCPSPVNSIQPKVGKACQTTKCQLQVCQWGAEHTLPIGGAGLTLLPGHLGQAALESTH